MSIFLYKNTNLYPYVLVFIYSFAIPEQTPLFVSETTIYLTMPVNKILRTKGKARE